MTRVSCPDCRLRFSSASAARFTSCPECARDLEVAPSAEATLGYRLFEAMDPPPAMPIAAEMALPILGDHPDQS